MAEKLRFYATITDRNVFMPCLPGTPMVGSIMDVTIESAPEEVRADMVRLLRLWADRLEGKWEANVIDFTRPEPFAVGARVRYSGARYGDPPEAYGRITALIAGDRPYMVAWDGEPPFPNDERAGYPASVLEREG